MNNLILHKNINFMIKDLRTQYIVVKLNQVVSDFSSNGIVSSLGCLS